VTATGTPGTPDAPATAAPPEVRRARADEAARIPLEDE